MVRGKNIPLSQGDLQPPAGHVVQSRIGLPVSMAPEKKDRTRTEANKEDGCEEEL